VCVQKDRMMKEGSQMVVRDFYMTLQFPSFFALSKSEKSFFLLCTLNQQVCHKNAPALAWS